MLTEIAFPLHKCRAVGLSSARRTILAVRCHPFRVWGRGLGNAHGNSGRLVSLSVGVGVRRRWGELCWLANVWTAMRTSWHRHLDATKKGEF